MKRLEYMRLKITNIPDEVIEHNKLRSLVTQDGYLLRNNRRNVRLAPSRGHSTRTPWKETIRVWLPAKQDHQRILDAQNQTNLFLPRGRRFRGEIGAARRRGPFNKCDQEILSDNGGQGSKEIHWTRHRVGLCESKSSHPHARLPPESVHKIQARSAGENPKLAASSCDTTIQSEDTLCQGRQAVHNDAGYCNKKNAHSRAGGHFFLLNNETFPPNNGTILTIATMIKAVMSSAAEAELGAL